MKNLPNIEYSYYNGATKKNINSQILNLVKSPKIKKIAKI